MNNGTNIGRKTSESKIKDLDELGIILNSLRIEGQKIVHCHGVFDLLHIGHIRHFQQAKKWGDILVVTTTQDKYVNKGEGRPAFTEQLRAEAIAALDCVDFVGINQWPQAVDTIRLLQPHIYVKGSDYKDPDDDHTGGILLEEEAVREVGGEIAFTDEITFSSSNLINRHLPVLPQGASEYVLGLSDRYSANKILGYLEGARSLKVLAIGEAIIDEYIYCETLGKSGKEPVLVSRQIDSERFAGGVIAVANNIASFSDNVSLLTFLGQVDSHESFIKEHINPKIDSTFLRMEDDSPTILKRRFVDRSPFHVQKLFELYVMGDGESKPMESEALCNKLQELIHQYDVVLVTDYGHGMISQEVVDLLCREARFLAVNTQMNAGNLGFNTVSKYSRADFLCVSENELRLDARSRRRDIQQLMTDISVKLGCDRVLITQGPNGCICYGKDEGFFRVPALTSNVVDRVGAGDSVFALSNLCAVQEAPIEIVGFVGSLAGAQAVATIGHRDSLDRVSLLRHMETLLK